jgi:peptide/nickel transport system ATP-binding protein
MNEAIIEVEGASKIFKKKATRREGYQVKALDSVDIAFYPGKIVGLVGESGSGKTTLGLSIAGLVDLNSGSIRIEGTDIRRLKSKHHGKGLWKKVQMIFQDPYESLNDRLTVKSIVESPVNSYLGNLTSEEKWEQVRKTLELVGLNPPEQFSNSSPRSLSGGERQRVSIARAIVSDPEFLVADEPVSMLDASIRASILEVLSNLRSIKSTAILFVSHDIAIASYLSDTIAVMHQGQIVEKGPPRRILANPMHPYTKILLASVPRGTPDFYEDDDSVSASKWQEIPRAIMGCSFAHKCPYVMEKCTKVKPETKTVESDHSVACYLY